MSANKKNMQAGGGGDYGVPRFAETYFKEAISPITAKSSANPCSHSFVAGTENTFKKKRLDV